MEFTIWDVLLRLFLFFILPNILSMLLGFLLYWFGAKKVGHYFVAMSSTLLGFLHKWLESHCPYDYDEECRCWTCSHYEECAMPCYNHLNYIRNSKK